MFDRFRRGPGARSHVGVSPSPIGPPPAPLFGRSSVGHRTGPAPLSPSLGDSAGRPGYGSHSAALIQFSAVTTPPPERAPGLKEGIKGAHRNCAVSTLPSDRALRLCREEQLFKPHWCMIPSGGAAMKASIIAIVFAVVALSLASFIVYDRWPSDWWPCTGSEKETAPPTT